MEDGYQKVAISDGEIRKKEQKDAELDKKILALRKKNEALIRRYQEIEEDKKNAEKEAMSFTSRKPKLDSLTITITKKPNERRVVSERWRDLNDYEDEEHQFTLRMGNKMQLAVTMDSKGTRAVSKNTEQDCLQLTRELSDVTIEDADRLFTYGRGRRMQIAITMEKEEEKQKSEWRRTESDTPTEKEQTKKESQKCELIPELTLTMTGQERQEYLRWKKEREQIDLERLARHKNSKGEWRRAWDMEKTEKMFEDDLLYVDAIPAGPCLRRGLGKTVGTSGDNAPKTILAMSSKAQGKDRLTGRAKRWGSMEGGDASCMLEELSTQEGLDCPDNAGLPLTDTETPKCPQEKINEGVQELYNCIKQRCPPGNLGKAVNGSRHQCAGITDSCCEFIKCSEVNKAQEGSSGTENILDITPLEGDVRTDTGADLPKEGIAMEYLSVLNSDRELKSGQMLQAVEEEAESRDCFTNTQVDCC
ncbi:coiled-coil domain-containing protein 9B isoform 2-T3 [Discoglossus pictus]